MTFLFAAGVGAAFAQGCGSNGSTPFVPEDAAPGDATAGDARSDSATALDGTSPSEAAPADATADATADSGITDSAADAQVCNALPNTAPAVLSAVSDAAMPPASNGMAIASGTYFLTSATSYGGDPLCAGIMVRGTTVVSATNATTGTLDGVITYMLGLLGQTTTVHAVYTTSGSALTLTATCPANDGGNEITQYSATPTTITVVQPAPPQVSGCGQVLEVFTKQ